MARLPVPGSDDGTWGEVLNAYLLESHTIDGSLKNNAVTNSTLSPEAVSSSKIAAGSIEDSHISLTADIAQSKIRNLTQDLSAKADIASTIDKSVVTDKGDLLTVNDAGTITRQPSGPDESVLTADSSSPSGLSWQPAPAKSPVTLPYSHFGSLGVLEGDFRLYNDSGANWTITSVRATVGSVPQGSSIIIDINVDGVSIFSTQSNRPTIAVDEYTSGPVTSIDLDQIAVGSYITIDVDQVGSTVPGSNLTVQVEVK